ncbi:MAG: NAD-dependent dehydratase [Chloroflexi bacterium HGW-Chloroflexi-6]|nr:MAG: NAD-dependent dehydratase [Chloroflexi bacterium HGW-Chloroflexi-6]
MSEFWSGKRVLVTGAGGFIGSHLVETLLHGGAQVRAFIRYNARNDPGLLALLKRQDFEALELVTGDLRDADAVRQAVTGVSHVFHLGALIAIPYSYLHPVEVVESNIIGTLNVLLAARDLGVERLVHTSSSEVYGSALRVPIDEGHPLQGQSPYSASKIGADKLAESFYCSYNLPVVTLRPFNTFGPRQSARAVIPTMITQALTGSTIRLGNLDTRRDFTYVSDTVAGFLKVAAAPGVEGQTINLGTGSDVRIGDLAEQIIAMLDHPAEIVIENQRLRPEKSEVQRLISDNRLALETLGWSPQVGIEEGLRRTFEWIRENLSRYITDRYVV